MRVSRRTRPSQVGFAASIGRRRLLQAFDPQPAAKIEPLSTDGLRMVIRLDLNPSASGNVLETGDGRLQTAAVASSRARGR